MMTGLLSPARLLKPIRRYRTWNLPKVVANVIGVRSTLFYAIVGIGGLWLAFLMSGVHATIAAVLAAFTIPANVKVSEIIYPEKLSSLLNKFKAAQPNNLPTVTNEQLHILEEVREISKFALTPLQRLEHSLHPLVAFVIMPIFALCNAGIEISSDFTDQMFSPVAVGTFFGLFAGKFIGVVGAVFLMLALKLAVLPDSINKLHIVGAGFLAAIGFTMSLFISGLAFNNPEFEKQAKIGILCASVIASFIGYFIIRKASQTKSPS